MTIMGTRWEGRTDDANAARFSSYEVFIIVSRPKDDRGRQSLYLQMAATVISLIVLISVFVESKTLGRTLKSAVVIVVCLIVLAVIGSKLFKSRAHQQRNEREP